MNASTRGIYKHKASAYQLQYLYNYFKDKRAALGGIRTHDTLFSRRVLYHWALNNGESTQLINAQ